MGPNSCTPTFFSAAEGNHSHRNTLSGVRPVPCADPPTPSTPPHPQVHRRPELHDDAAVEPPAAVVCRPAAHTDPSPPPPPPPPPPGDLTPPAPLPAPMAADGRVDPVLRAPTIPLSGMAGPQVFLSVLFPGDSHSALPSSLFCVLSPFNVSIESSHHSVTHLFLPPVSGPVIRRWFAPREGFTCFRSPPRSIPCLLTPQLPSSFTP